MLLILTMCGRRAREGAQLSRLAHDEQIDHHHAYEGLIPEMQKSNSASSTERRRSACSTSALACPCSHRLEARVRRGRALWKAAARVEHRRGMLESHGSIDDDFVKLLSEDNREVLREGEFGDMNVRIEDRLINASLSSIQSSEKAQIKALFQWFAVFPVRSLSRDENYAMSLPLYDHRKTCLFHSPCWTCSHRWSLGRASSTRTSRY